MEIVEPAISRDIYPMPAFVTLEVPDVDRTVDWYVNGLDFILLFTLPGPGGAPALEHPGPDQHGSGRAPAGVHRASSGGGAGRAVRAADPATGPGAGALNRRG